jgi:hypothetical protein
LSGGVGNQLFQYAAGRTIAAERDLPLQVSARRAHATRTLGIRDLLDVPKSALTRHERFLAGFPDAAFEWMPLALRKTVRTLDRRIARYFVLEQAQLQMADPKPELDDHWRYIHLRGFFQHPTYYEPVLDAVIEEMVSKLRDKLDVTSGDGVVAMHFRRGDYVLNGYDLPLSFHEEALAAVANAHSVRRVVVMSDDVAFSALAAEHFGRRGFDVLDFESESGHTDLDSFLMLATAQHVVMSNSTFVWWAALIGDRLRRTNRMVVCPKPWMPARAAASIPVDRVDLARAEWVVQTIDP